MESNKDKAVAFLQRIVAGQIDKAFETYVSPDLIHHNPYFPGDAESLRTAMKQNGDRSPEKIITVKQTMEEAGRVMVYSHIQQNASDIGAAVVHLFRFYEGKIVEMWDVGQPLNADSPNENGMF
ncbi:polyketide cyclase [Sporosarcina sp. NCCP-2222]|uniref:nuclear transport factor 2 family protein n=1 Tax=Sporosarcina sp. NCCP-2222 TaxID=2935073 RepID=UPI002082504A|nr:ester cyclase [Sporosarcina sp. NCCP-2222]GKV56446.1 polyketide cyclase [Sporosarcina sp. NCCP-2222]